MNTAIEYHPLPAFLHGEPPQETEGGFVIDDDQKAAWAANKVLAARRRIAARVQLSVNYQARILDWLVKANQKDEMSAGFLEGSLRPWLERAIAGQGKIRSISLLGARVGFRKSPDKVEVFDPEAVIAFCEEHSLDAVQVKKDVSKTSLKQHLAAGARIPGAMLVPGTDELVVRGDDKGEIE